MRAKVDVTKIHLLMKEIGRRAKGPGSIFFTGGASALLEGWRESTVDIDIKLDPEPAGIFEAISHLKTELDVSVELASPDQFLPPLHDWRNRSESIGHYGRVQFFHYDFRAQALSKLARGHTRDIDDVEAMVCRGLVRAGDLKAGLEEMRPNLIRYPGLRDDEFISRVESFVEKFGKQHE